MGLTNAGALIMAAKLVETIGTDYNNANAHIGVGDSNAAFAATQVDLQGASTLKKPMVASYPQRSGAALTFRSLFGASDANFTWAEWGIFNGSGAGGAGPTGVVMLSRRVEALGTKTSSEIWQITVTATPTAA